MSALRAALWRRNELPAIVNLATETVREDAAAYVTKLSAPELVDWFAHTGSFPASADRNEVRKAELILVELAAESRGHRSLRMKEARAA